MPDIYTPELLKDFQDYVRGFISQQEWLQLEALAIIQAIKAPSVPSASVRAQR